jgi:hypothetical protein
MYGPTGERIGIWKAKNPEWVGDNRVLRFVDAETDKLVKISSTLPIVVTETNKTYEDAPQTRA